MKYGETAKIKTWIDEYDGLRVTYGYEILTERDVVAAEGFTKHVCVKRDTFRPISLRKMYPDWHIAYENAKKINVDKKE